MFISIPLACIPIFKVRYVHDFPHTIRSMDQWAPLIGVASEVHVIGRWVFCCLSSFLSRLSCDASSVVEISILPNIVEMRSYARVAKASRPRGNSTWKPRGSSHQQHSDSTSMMRWHSVGGVMM